MATFTTPPNCGQYLDFIFILFILNLPVLIIIILIINNNKSVNYFY